MYLPGILVPKATNTIAVTVSLIPSVKPKCDATSPITAVTTPIPNIDTTKHKYPPQISRIQRINIIQINSNDLRGKEGRRNEKQNLKIKGSSEH